MKKKSIFRTMLCGIVMASLLSVTACSGGKKPGAEVTMWALTGGGDATIKQSVEDWNKANPDRPISIQMFGNDAFKEKIRTAIGAKNPPTLIYGWGGGVMRDYAEAGAIIDLGDQLKELTDTMAPGVVNNGKVGDKSYGIPNNGTKPVMLFYNKDVFEEHSLTPPETWDDLLTIVEKLKGTGIAPLSLGGQSKWPELMWIAYLTDRIGGPEVFQAVIDQKPDAWSDPAISEALTKIQDLIKAGGFVDSFASIGTDDSADLALLHTGQAAMVVQGSWAYPDFVASNPDFVSAGKLGYTSFPVVTGGKGDANNITGNPSNYWSVSAYASEEQQKTAIDYMKSQTMNPKYAESLIAGGMVPPVAGQEAEIAKVSDGEYLGYTYSMAMNAPHFQASWDQALPSAQGQALLQNLDKIFLQDITPAEFVTAMNATIGK